MKVPTQLVLVIAGAAVMPLCYPPFGWWPLLFPAYLPLLLATTNTPPRRAFRLGILHGLIGYGGSLYWLVHIFGVAAISLFLIIALFTAFFCLLHNQIERRFTSPALKVLVAATLWTGIEFFRGELFWLRFPWIAPGSALGPTWLSPIVGVYGASFLVIAACAAFMHRATRAWASALAACILLLGFFPPGPVVLEEDDSIAVTVVQSETSRLDDYVARSRATLEAWPPDLVIWPEYAVPFDVRESAPDFEVLTHLCAEMDAVLVLGTETVFGEGPDGWHNTALVLNEHGVVGEYYKARPVHFFDDGVAGENFEPIRTDLGAVGTPICFDCDYTEIIRRMVRHGAEFLAVPSFDAAFWTAAQHVQHALQFRLRAAENGRWLACAASSGVSQIIDPHGRVQGRLPPLTEGVLTGRIGRVVDRGTFFSRVGWLFPWLTFGGSVLYCIWCLRPLRVH